MGLNYGYYFLGVNETVSPGGELLKLKKETKKNRNKDTKKEKKERKKSGTYTEIINVTRP